jgi:hypothetical protein
MLNEKRESCHYSYFIKVEGVPVLQFAIDDLVNSHTNTPLPALFRHKHPLEHKILDAVVVEKGSQVYVPLTLCLFLDDCL